MKNKIIFISLLIGVMILASCSNDAGNSSDSGDAEFNFISWSSEESSGKVIEDKMVKTWNEENPENQFSVMGYPWDQTLQQLTLKSGSEKDMDVAQIQSSWFNILASQDVLVDLNEELDS